jgi:hypothetical protein
MGESDFRGFDWERVLLVEKCQFSPNLWVVLFISPPVSFAWGCVLMQNAAAIFLG